MPSSKGQPGAGQRAHASLEQGFGLGVARPHRAPRDQANQKARARTEQYKNEAARRAQPEAARAAPTPSASPITSPSTSPSNKRRSMRLPGVLASIPGPRQGLNRGAARFHAPPADRDPRAAFV